MIEIDVAGLTEDLLEAGLPISGVDATGWINGWNSPPSREQEEAAKRICDTHDAQASRARREARERERNRPDTCQKCMTLEGKVAALEARLATIEDIAVPPK